MRRGALALLAVICASTGYVAPAEVAGECLEWNVVHTGVGLRPIVADDGRLVVFTAGDTVQIAAPPSPPPPAGTPWPLRWETLRLPSGAEPNGAVMGDDTLWLTAKMPDGRAFVWKKAGASGWQSIDVGAIASLYSPELDETGRLWVGGEWGEVFVLDGKGWSKEHLPLPYHARQVVAVPGGVVWVAGRTRNLSALFRRTEEGWTTVATDANRLFSEILRATAGDVTVRTRNGAAVYRLDDPDLTTATVTEISYPGPVFTGDTRSGWLWTGTSLQSVQNGQLHPVPVVAVPMQVRGLYDGGDWGLFGELESRRLARLEPCDAVPKDSGVPYPFESLFPPASLVQPNQGAAVVRIGSREHLYVVDHLAPNPTARLVLRADGTFDPELDYRERSRLLRNEGPVRSEFSPIYDVAALSADLNGDDREELLLFSMYDVNRLFLSRGDRFVDWTEESGIGGGTGDDTATGCLLDADDDGDLDLYVANILVPDRLYRNNGAARFDDVTRAAGIVTANRSHSALCADLDLDGDTDIAVATWGRGLLIHENLGGRGVARFRTTAWRDTEGDLSQSNLNSLALSDPDGDGLPDLFVAIHVGCDLVLRNRGGLRFERWKGYLPEDERCVTTYGANFFDADHDGDLDAALTGQGGSRIYFQEEDGRLHWHRDLAWWDERDLRLFNGSALLDVDQDGDLDLYQGGMRGSPVFYRNRIDDDRSILLRVIGPPANRSAVGATVELWQNRGTPSARLVERREVNGGSGYASMDTKWVHFGGVTPGEVYEAVVRLPGGATGSLGDLTPPYRGELALSRTGLLGRAEEIAYRVGHSAGNPWHLRWMIATASLVLLLALGLWMLEPAARRRPMTWLPLPAYLAGAATTYALLPLDPGVLPVGLAAGLPWVGALALALGQHAARRRRPADELLVELNLALRVFRHNQTPQRVLDRVRFSLNNCRPGPGAALNPGIEQMLREDLLAFREVVLPEMRSLGRLATALELDTHAAEKETRRLAALAERVIEGTGNGGPLQALRQAIDAWDERIERLRRQTDRLLLLDLPDELQAYTSSRRKVTGCAIDLDLPEDRRLVVRFLRADLHRVLDVLLENAERATRDAEEARVRIETGRQNGHAFVRFSDTGFGIPVEDRESLFDAGRTTSGNGHGYGLHFARRIVQRFGGEIWAEPSTHGATFRIELEIPREHAEEAAG